MPSKEGKESEMAAEDTVAPVIQYADKLLAYGINDVQTVTKVAGAEIFIQSIGISSEGESKTYKDNTGKTCALIIPEQYQVLTVEGIMLQGKSSLTPPKKGDKVTDLPVVAGMDANAGAWRVESCSVNWSNEDVTKVSLSVRSYDF